METYNRIFILGAGFSKSFCNDMPTIIDLTGEIFSSSNNECQELRKFAKKYFSESNNSEEIKNIENLATAIFSKRIFEDCVQEQYYKTLRNQVLMLILKYIKQHNVDDPNDPNRELLSDFIWSCRRCWIDKRNDIPGKNLIMSFNYDLIIENIVRKVPKFRECAINYSVGLTPYAHSSSQDSSGWVPEFIEILKLHGSFNWFRAKGSRSNDINSIYIVNEDDDAYAMHQTDVPVYIPMAHAKESFLTGTLYNTIWAKATHYLRNADEIVFVGYGFPITDINNLIYFLDYNDRIKHVVVREKEESDNLRRLRRLFGKKVVKNMDAKEFLLSEYISKKDPP